MGEISKQGFDPESFFAAYKTYGPPMTNLLQKLENHEGDVVLIRACLLEDLEKTQPDIFKRFRVLEGKERTIDFAANIRQTCIQTGHLSQPPQRPGPKRAKSPNVC